MAKLKGSRMYACTRRTCSAALANTSRRLLPCRDLRILNALQFWILDNVLMSEQVMLDTRSGSFGK